MEYYREVRYSASGCAYRVRVPYSPTGRAVTAVRAAYAEHARRAVETAKLLLVLLFILSTILL